MKHFFLAISLIATITCPAAAQSKRSYGYIKENIIVDDSLNYDFIRTVQEPDSASTYYKIVDLYPGGKVKTKGFATQINPQVIWEGQIFEYDTSGSLFRKYFINNGYLKGYVSTYYPNGKLKKVEKCRDSMFLSRLDYIEARLVDNSDLISFYNNTGTQLVKDGNGFLKDETLETEGSYVNGVKHGIWKEKLKGNAHEETYENGNFVKGTVLLSNGKTNKYTMLEERPEYPGGIDTFSEYMKSSFYDSGLKISRAGIIELTFVIDEGGRMVELSIRNDLDDERKGLEKLTRVLNRSKNWNPGKQRGVPVRVKFSFPYRVSTF